MHEQGGFGQSAGGTATIEKYTSMSRTDLAEHARQIQNEWFADLSPPQREALEPVWNALVERVDTAPNGGEYENTS
jgi:hypothetical protein